MAHVKIQYDVMDAFCMDVFQRFGFTKKKAVLFPMFYYSQMFTGLNPMARGDLSATTKVLPAA